MRNSNKFKKEFKPVLVLILCIYFDCLFSYIYCLGNLLVLYFIFRNIAGDYLITLMLTARDRLISNYKTGNWNSKVSYFMFKNIADDYLVTLIHAMLELNYI